MSASESPPTPVPPRGGWARVGLGLIAASFLLWVPLPALPFLSLDLADKAMIGGGLALVAEVAFWGGALLAGPEAARRARSWFRRRRVDPPAPADTNTDESTRSERSGTPPH